MTGTSVWPILLLKLPIAGIIGVVWWKIHTSREEPLPAGEEDGGAKVYGDGHPRRPLPRKPRRGPHGGACVSPPTRVRSVHAQARKITC
jgi:hypothetical protein